MRKVALVILSIGIAPECRLRAIEIEPACRAFEGLLNVLRNRYITPLACPPPFAQLDPLREHGIPLVPEAEFQDSLEQYREVRCLIQSYVEFGGWKWETVTAREA